jgi:hypothetical protein
MSRKTSAAVNETARDFVYELRSSFDDHSLQEFSGKAISARTILPFDHFANDSLSMTSHAHPHFPLFGQPACTPCR